MYTGVKQLGKWWESDGGNQVNGGNQVVGIRFLTIGEVTDKKGKKTKLVHMAIV